MIKVKQQHNDVYRKEIIELLKKKKPQKKNTSVYQQIRSHYCLLITSNRTFRS